ncbi:MAG TPA: hypothetical protein VF189_06625 [Patescibacteria group bacterium]
MTLEGAWTPEGDFLPNRKDIDEPAGQSFIPGIEVSHWIRKGAKWAERVKSILAKRKSRRAAT